MPVPEDAMEAQPDVEMGTESVRSGTKRISSTWEDCAGKINREACLNTVGECRRCDADEVLATVAGVRSETHTDTRVRSVQVASQIQKVIHGDSHQHENVPRSQEKQSPAKNCDTDAVRVSEHYASTPCTRTQRLTINRMVSKCRARQPESCDTLSAFLHYWLERGAWAEPPTDLRLNDGWCWLPKALLLLSPVSERSVVVRKHPRDDRREARGKPGRSP